MGTGAAIGAVAVRIINALAEYQDLPAT